MTDGAGTSRIEHARRKSADAKRRLSAAAGVSFLVAALLAWVSHAGAQPASGASSVVHFAPSHRRSFVWLAAMASFAPKLQTAVSIASRIGSGVRHHPSRLH